MTFWVAGAALVGTVASASANKSAAGKAAAATDRGTEVLRENFLDTKESLDPFISSAEGAPQMQRTIAGLEGPEAQQKFFDEFQFSPFAKFQREEGLKVGGQSNARLGTLRSGSRLKSISKFINDLTSREVNNRFNQAGAITGTGLSAASALAGVSTSSSQGQANLIQQGGETAAAATLGRSQALQSGVSDIAAVFANREPKQP